MRRLNAKHNFGLHIGKLFLNELVGRERPAKLAPFQRVGPRGFETGFGRAHRPPTDAEAGVTEAAKGRFQPDCARQDVLFWHRNAIHAGWRGPQ